MFTGIIEMTGTLVDLTSRAGCGAFTVEASASPGGCGRATRWASPAFVLLRLTLVLRSFTPIWRKETLDCTSLGALTPGAKVNLELPTAAGSPLGGHIVQGHRGRLRDDDRARPGHSGVEPQLRQADTDWTLKVRVPEKVRPWMVHKGSVAVEGISLTIAEFDGEAIAIAILPLTYWRTNLHTLNVGAPVNVEADVLVKLAHAQLLAEKKPELELTEAWLVASGF